MEANILLPYQRIRNFADRQFGKPLIAAVGTNHRKSQRWRLHGTTLPQMVLSKNERQMLERVARTGQCLPVATPVILSEKHHPAPDAPMQACEMNARILIADDNRDAADTMGMLLELGGHEVIVAHSGNQALELGRQRRPDVVILDIGMPDINGYEVARTARNEDWGKSAYMIALTGWGQADDKERARMAGFDRHLTKPVDPDLVEEILKRYLIGKQST
jgi:CheY-like chemotaxis protein